MLPEIVKLITDIVGFIDNHILGIITVFALSALTMRIKRIFESTRGRR